MEHKPFVMPGNVLLDGNKCDVDTLKYLMENAGESTYLHVEIDHEKLSECYSDEAPKDLDCFGINPGVKMIDAIIEFWKMIGKFDDNEGVRIESIKRKFYPTGVVYTANFEHIRWNTDRPNR